ncbi:hypothetical protein EAF04_000950 [Stromatinia cepivora]|nr:hypothetical protein EAF04_000950 [Stromatinia cepivora]
MGKRDDICSILGYEKDKPTKDCRNLLKATSAFLADYEARGNKVYGRKAESIGGRLCALNFLEEEGRGERFWPPTSDGSLVYEEARDKEIIVDHVADLFLIHARSNYGKLHAKRRSQKYNATSPSSNVNNEHISNKPPTSITPEETYIEDEEPQFTYSSSLMTIKPELCLTPWLDPPKRFDRNVAMPWAESLNPKSLPDPPVRLGKNWLSQEIVRWPAAIDKEIQYFMHRWVFYYTTDLENGADDGIQSLVDLLRNDKGASTELDSTQLREFEKRVVDRVKFFTETFVNHQFVELQADGVPQMTARFRAIWTTLKYETPTPRVSHRRRSVEKEVPKESPRKRRKLSKKAEENALDGNRPKRKPWSEHAWRRKTIPPPADMTFPNLLSRKSSNIDPVTAVESPRDAVDEEESEEEVFENCETGEGSETTVRSSKISVEIPPPNKAMASKCDAIIDMEEESTIEVLQFEATVIEISDDEHFSETAKALLLTREKNTKDPSPNPDDILASEIMPPQIEDEVSEAKLILPRQSNKISEDCGGLSQEPQISDVTVTPKQSLEIVTVGSGVNKVMDAQKRVTGSDQGSPQAEPQSQLPETAIASSVPTINGTPEDFVEASTQPVDLDEHKNSSRHELVKAASPTQIAGQTDELMRGVASPHQTATENQSHNAPTSTVPSTNTSSDNPKKYGPFHDLEFLNHLFSSSGSRPVDINRPPSISSISPTSSTEAHTRELGINFSSVNAIQNSVLPRTSPSVESNLNSDPHNKLPSKDEIPVVSQTAVCQPVVEESKHSAHSPETVHPQSGDSIKIPIIDVSETPRKLFEKSARTPLPSVPLSSKSEQKMANRSPTAQQSTTTIGERHKPPRSPQMVSQKPAQSSQAPMRDPLIATFQPINRPTNGFNSSSPSNYPPPLATEPPQPSPVPATQNSATSIYHPPMASQEVLSRKESGDTNQHYKQNEPIPAQNIVCESTLPGTLSGSSWARDVHINSYSMNKQNGVYPMAFINKSIASSSGIWMQEASRKRPLERTSTKPRKTKSRKKSGPPEKPTTKSATAKYSQAQPAHADQDVPSSAMQTESPRQPIHGREHSPKPPHLELINHLRSMDEKMGVNSGAPRHPASNTTNLPPPASNQQPINHAENIGRNTMYYDVRQEQNLLNYIALQEKMHSTGGRSSQDWGKVKTSVDVHHATSVASPAQSYRPSSMSQIQPSPPENPIARTEQATVEYGMQQNKRSPNVGEQNQINFPSSQQRGRNHPKASEQSKINPGMGTTQTQTPSNVNAKSSFIAENRSQSSNSAHIGHSEPARSLETGIRQEALMANGTGSIIPKSTAVTDSNTPRNLPDPQGTQNRGYRSQDPWWNSLAANYGIEKISQPTSRHGPQPAPSVLRDRSVGNAAPVSTVQTAPQIQAESQEYLPDTRKVASSITERPHSTGIESSKLLRQTPESQHVNHSSVQPSNIQGSPPQSYSGKQYATQPSPMQQSNSAVQILQPRSGTGTSTPLNQFSNQALSPPSYGRVPSPKNQFHQSSSQPSSHPNASLKARYTSDTIGRPLNTQTSNFQHHPLSQSPVQPATIQNAVPQNQFTNQSPTQFSPIQASSPQNQYTAASVNKQASLAPVANNAEYNERQDHAAPQYQYHKRPQQPIEPQAFTMQAQQKIYNGQQPHDWTKYRLKDASPQTTMHSINSSPRQLPSTKNQVINASPVQPSTIQIPTTRSPSASTMPTILNPSLPPTPPTPAVIPTPKSDPMSLYPPGNYPLAGISPRHLAPDVISNPTVDNTPRYYPGVRVRPLQQTPAAISTPRLDTTSQYSPSTHPLATPQQTPTTPQESGPKLDFYLQRSNAIIDTSISFSYHYMEALSLSNLFSFFSQRSGISLERLDELTFRCMFGEYQQFVIGKNMGDGEWKRARKRIWRNWDREVRTAKQKGDDEDEEFWEVNILIGKCA